MVQTPTISHQKFYRQVNFLLILVFFVKLGGFFTWSENINITRVIKVFSRVMMTVAIFGIYKRILRQGAVASFQWKHSLSPVFYGLYLLLGLISFLWSTNVGYSALQLFMDAECFLFAYYFIGCFILLDHYFPSSGIRLSNVMAQAVFLMLMIFVIGQYAAPNQFYRLTHGGEEARLGGYIMNPNELGMLGAVGVSCLIFNLPNKRVRIYTIIQIVILLYAIVMTGSRSTTIGCMLITFFHINQSKNKRLKWIMYAGALMVIPVAINKMVVKENAGGLDEVMNMTGRIPFWHALLTEGLPKEPLLGFGFMRIAYGEYFSSVHSYAAGMTHNTFIQVIMNLGFIGFGIVLFQMFFTLRGYFSKHEKQKNLLFVGLIIPVMINSFTEFGIFGETNYGILFYQLLIFYLSLSINGRLTPVEKLFLLKKRPELTRSIP